MIRTCGGGWEQWEDELTIDRLKAILDSAEDLPPPHIMLFAIASALGALPEREGAGQTEEEASANAEAFLSMFGGDGRMMGGQ